MTAPFDISRLEAFDFRRHYEQVAIQSLGSVFKHRWMIAKIIGGAVLVAALLVAVLPRRYTAEALVQPQLFSRAEAGSTTALASIDGASLVASEAALIQSPSVAKAVVKRLSLDEQAKFARPGSLLGRALRSLRAAILPETVLTSPTERAIRDVRDKLTVTRDTRSYLISVGFNAAFPEEAARVANAFALEYANTKVMQRLSEAVATASRELARASTIYGENHPSLLRAAADLELAKQRLQSATDRPVGSDLAPGEGITLAEPSSAPSSPRGTVIIGLVFFAALIFGVSLSVWIEYRRPSARAKGGSRS
jgi:uncharacterized protein involved in exopolysaccharide biosynthesis